MQENDLNNNKEIMDIFKAVMENAALKVELANCNKSKLKCYELLDKCEEREKKWFKLEFELKTYKECFESPEEVLYLKKQLSLINDLFGSMKELPEIWDEVKSLRSADKFQKEIIDQKDYIYVTQFDRLYWGDNYPALKVFFNYLQSMNCLDINWSYFCNCMSLGNSNIIDLKSTVLGKHDLAYLLAITKKYYTDDCNGSAQKYLSVISRKFTIDGVIITKTFFGKYIREYKTGTIPIKLRKSELDDLSSKIAKAYR